MVWIRKSNNAISDTAINPEFVNITKMSLRDIETGDYILTVDPITLAQAYGKKTKLVITMNFLQPFLITFVAMKFSCVLEVLSFVFIEFC